MNDTLTPKLIVPSTLDAANFPGSALSFPRVQSTKTNEYQRQSSHVSSLSPTLLRVAHVRATSSTDVQRSLAALDQTLARLDAQSNPISFDRVSPKLQFEKTSGVTLAEYRTAWFTLLGLALANDGEYLDQLYNGEV